MEGYFEATFQATPPNTSSAQHSKYQLSNSSTATTTLDSFSSSSRKNRDDSERSASQDNLGGSSSLLVADSSEVPQRLSDRSSKKKKTKKKKDGKKKKKRKSSTKTKELSASVPDLWGAAGTNTAKEKCEDWSEWGGDTILFPHEQDALNRISLPEEHRNSGFLPPGFADQQKNASAPNLRERNRAARPAHDNDDLISALSDFDMGYQLTTRNKREDNAAPLDMMAQYMIAMGTDRQTATMLAAAFAAEQRKTSASTLTPPAMDDTATLVSALSSDDTRSFIQPEEQGDDMLAQYMVAMGTDRDTAQKLAAAFANEQKGRSQTAGRRASTGNARRRTQQSSMLQQKAKEAKRPTRMHQSASMPMHPPPRRNSSSAGLVHAPPHPYEAPPKRRPSGRYPSPMQEPWASTAKKTPAIVEARPVKEEDFLEDGGVVYAESTPLSLKHLIRERPFRRLVMLGACLLINGLIGGVLYYVFGRGDRGSDGLSSVLTASPTMAPSMAPTFIMIETYQAALKLSGEDALEEPNSPQLKAVGWMSSVDTLDTGDYDRIFEQRYALVTMFYSLGGEEWTNPEQWLNPEMHECDWGGLFCGTDATETRVVTGLDATRNNLQGTLPAEIGLLTSTELLRMPRNRMNGTIPASLGNLALLTSIDLNSNEFTGPIPSTIGDMRDLIAINLSGNNLEGSMPDSVYSLKLLQTLVLRDNSISGVLTQGVNNLTLLATLDLRQNLFTGTVPITFASLPALDLVWLDYNQFSGPIPVITKALVTRQTISVSHNQFEGNIEVHPSTFTTATDGDFRLHHVDLGYNKLVGPLTAVLGFLPSLRHLDLSGNQFTGAPPGYLGWEAIEFFALSNNLLTGTLPTGLPSGLTSLTHLDMSYNQFSGGIQEAYCEYENLEFLILSNNSLGGSMPDCLFEMERLRDLQLNDVLLSGTIPSEIGQLKDLEQLFLSGNSLEGSLPAQMGDLGEMKKLELDRNLLTGSIPLGLSRMTDLEVLNLEENNLDGVFPTQLQSLGELQSLHLAGNAITGAIPEELCQLETLNLTQQDLGCNIRCRCCGDGGDC